MNAIKLLKEQHQKVKGLFGAFEKAEDDAKKKRLFFDIADNLAVHATIEERYFYPAARAKATRDDVAEAYDEHLEVKKLILDGLKGTARPGFDGVVAALKGAVEHHVEEEETEFFPKVAKLLDPATLEAIGQQMEAVGLEMMAAGNPRSLVEVKSEPPAISHGKTKYAQ